MAATDRLAEATAEIAPGVERAVYEDGKHADRALALALRQRRDLALSDHRFISQAIFALFRWRGWIESRETAIRRPGPSAQSKAPS